MIYKDINQVIELLEKKGWKKEEHYSSSYYFDNLQEEHNIKTDFVLYPTKKYKLDINIYLEQEDIIKFKVVACNCHVQCCGEYLGSDNFSFRKLRKMITKHISQR